MRVVDGPLVLAAIASALLWPLHASVQTSRMIAIDGHQMNVWSGSPGMPQQGQPAIVFENGLNSALENWGTVLTAVAGFAQVVAYDRAGNGRSEPDGQPPTPQHVAKRLRELLTRIGVKPPYILVGHSWGGPLIRKFATLYPNDVAGLVYVDPTELRTQEDERTFYTALGYSEDQLTKRRERRREQARGIGGEMLVAQQLADSYFAEFRGLAPLGGPVAVLMSGKFNSATWSQEPCHPRECHQSWIRLRLASLTRLAAEGTEATVTLTTANSHDISKDDPNLVVWAIQRVLRAVTRRE